MQRFYRHTYIAALASLLTVSGIAQETGSPAYKLTTGYYQYSGAAAQNGTAVDINLRHSTRDGNVWLGHYVSWAHDIRQDRIGLDRLHTAGPLRIMPSLQLATGGAWNGSLGVETGDSWFAGAGIGRTNLRDSVSLNFDPNDAYSLSGGYRGGDGESVSFVLVRDNRLNPDQQHLHLVYRRTVNSSHRLTIDALLKRGLVDEEMIEKTGLSIAYDWPRWFLRLSYDPNANFTPQDLWRLSAGTRF